MTVVDIYEGNKSFCAVQIPVAESKLLGERNPKKCCMEWGLRFCVFFGSSISAVNIEVLSSSTNGNTSQNLNTASFNNFM